MATITPSFDSVDQHLLRLPRELRDLIYEYAVEDELPIELGGNKIQTPFNNSSISAEYLEAIHEHKGCTITFTNTRWIWKFDHDIWAPNTEHIHLIRHLTVNAVEAGLIDDDAEKLEKECKYINFETRKEWYTLLKLPRLESLSINLSKSNAHSFVWANFSPVVYQLRERNPNLRVTLNVSFDHLLKDAWDSTIVGPDGQEVSDDDPYLPMNFTDVSELIQPPTEEDWRHVGENLQGLQGVESIDVVRGLLDETPANRRLLAQFYIAKEPALLRVMMAKHYEIYKRIRGEEHVV